MDRPKMYNCLFVQLSFFNLHLTPFTTCIQYSLKGSCVYAPCVVLSTSHDSLSTTACTLLTLYFIYFMLFFFSLSQLTGTVLLPSAESFCCSLKKHQ